MMDENDIDDNVMLLENIKTAECNIHWFKTIFKIKNRVRWPGLFYNELIHSFTYSLIHF